MSLQSTETIRKRIAQLRSAQVDIIVDHWIAELQAFGICLSEQQQTNLSNKLADLLQLESNI